jgi:CPA2 family monovalent cation:H+ antiporter-2
VLFFISVGMLFDPSILIREPLAVLTTVAIIVVVKSFAALAIVLAFRHPLGTALTIAASLAQIGEFSFILVGLGVAQGLLPELGRELILAGAIISIVLNPVLFLALDRMRPWLDRRDAGQTLELPGKAAPAPAAATKQHGHAILVGYGRIGHWIGETLERTGVPFLVIDEKDDVVEKLKSRNVEAFAGNAAALLQLANPAGAAALLVAIPDAFEAGQIVAQARAVNGDLRIVAHAHSDAEAAYLSNYGATVVVQGAREIADAMATALAASRQSA